MGGEGREGEMEESGRERNLNCKHFECYYLHN